LVDVPGDGHCAIYAVIDQLKPQGVELDVKTVRRQALQYLREHPDKFDENFLSKDEYLDREDYFVKQSGDHWCDELMLRAVSAVLERAIYVLSDDGQETILQGFERVVDVSNVDFGDCLRLGHIRERHYVSLRDVIVEPDISSQSPDASSLSSTVENVKDTSDVNKHPPVWDTEQWLVWKSKHTWLICEGGKLGCSVCRNVNINIEATQGVRLSDEWRSVAIKAETKRKLKEKIYRHNKSEAHNHALSVIEQKQKETLKTVVVDSQSRQFSETIRIFRTAYCVAKQNLAFTVHDDLVELQQLNGLDMGYIHRSDHSCAKIIGHIAEQMKMNLTNKIVDSENKISFMLDEATLYGASAVVFYLRTCLNADFKELGQGQDVENIFLSLAEATDGTSASAIFSLTTGEFHRCNMTDDWLKRSLVGVCTDGASVMSGCNRGLAKLIVDAYGPQVEFMHCMAHRLELSVADALKSVTATNHFQAFITSIYSLYSQSPKNQRELGRAASETETVILRIKGVFTVRWVASSFRAVKAVWRDFPALVSHFQAAANDCGRTTSERSKFVGLQKKLANVKFLCDLALMKDVLREISFLSLKLQERQISVNEAVSNVQTTVKVLQAIKANDGQSSKKIQSCLAKASQENIVSFKGVALQGTAEQKGNIDKKQFLQAVIDSVTRRFPDPSRQFIKDLSVLDPEAWPEDDSRLLYGDDEVVRMCKAFGLPVRTVIDQFRNLKDGKRGGPEFNKLLAIRQTYPASSAECERGRPKTAIFTPINYDIKLS